MAVKPVWSTAKGTIRNSEAEATTRDNAEYIATQLTKYKHLPSDEWEVAVCALETAALHYGVLLPTPV